MFKLTKHEVSLVESYLIAFLTSSAVLYSSGDHHIKHDLWSAGLAVFGPVYLSLKKKAKAFVDKHLAPVVVPPVTK